MGLEYINSFDMQDPYMKKNPFPLGIELKPLDLDRIVCRFTSTITDINNYTKLSIETETSESTKNNLYRSQVIMIVSAFDSFLHEISKAVVIYMFNHQWKNNTDAFFKIRDILVNEGQPLTKSNYIEVMHDHIKRKTFYNYRKGKDEGIEYGSSTLLWG